jgi:REP element-mobilizing transposase RayT
MGQSLSQLYVHLVFSTKHREPWLDTKVQDRLFPYLAAALNRQDCPAIKVGGHVDHVHLLFHLHRTKAASDVVGSIKGESSKWMKREVPTSTGFAWQAGFGLFSVSASQVGDVSDYIGRQSEHHRKMTFQDEYRALLRRFDLEWDERYVWD